MPAALIVRGHHERALSIRNCHDEDAYDAVQLTRLGPDIAGAKILGLNSRLPFSLVPFSENARLFDDFVGRHNATDSVATTSSLAGSDTDAEVIELTALRSLARTARTQSFVGKASSHGRFDSTASSTFTADSSASASASECDGIDKEEIGIGSAVRLSLEQAGEPSACYSQQTCVEDWNSNVSVLHSAIGRSELDTPPLTPMSPRQSHYPHRVYVPSNSHHDKQKHTDELSEVDLESSFPNDSARHSPDSADTIPAETDTLLPIRKNISEAILPPPVTSPTCDEPRTFPFSFSRLETSFHMLAILVTTFLVIFSIWLTLANIRM